MLVMVPCVNRLLPVACTAWLVSLLMIVPQAREQAPQQSRATNPHRDLSLFAHSDMCIACHNHLSTPDGEDVSIGTMWRATIMANSARDPYWHASVRREVNDHPTRAADIQDECASCHMPMAQRIARAAGAKGEVFAHLPIDKDDTPLQRIAADSISCTLCHQIALDTLGTPDSFDGNFVMKPTPRDGARRIYGRYNVDAGRRTIMRSVSGFVQEEAPHVKQSELCASCHTLITEALGPDGSVVGKLHEQMNYQEWRHSAFQLEQRGCQSCHMPAADGPVRIASVLGDLRDSLARHVFVGGNAFMLRMLNRYRAELGVTALGSELEATARATVRQLQQDSATVGRSSVQLADTTLSFVVDVHNLTGHRFPTGYPARRAWLHVVIGKAVGNIVFESGKVEPSGMIRGNDNDTDGSTFEPHYQTITAPDQVQIYESILGDPAGRPTTGLLTAIGYLKDNRLLPRGFDKATAPSEIGVYGAAAKDTTFTDGGDRVEFRVPVTGSGPVRVDVELRYQSIGFRWANNLEKYDAPEPARFVSYYKATSAASAIVVAAAAASVTR